MTDTITFANAPPCVREAVLAAGPTFVDGWRRLLANGETDRVGIVVDGGHEWRMGVTPRATFLERMASVLPISVIEELASEPGDAECAWVVVFTPGIVSTLRVKANPIAEAVS